jgi:hypothetical protein
MPRSCLSIMFEGEQLKGEQLKAIQSEVPAPEDNASTNACFPISPLSKAQGRFPQKVNWNRE